MWIIVLLVILAALIVVLVIDIVLRLIMKKKLSSFLDNYKLISLGMSKQEVVNLLGDKYTQNATMEKETFC